MGFFFMVTSLKSHNKTLRIKIKEPNDRLDKAILSAIPQDLGLTRSRVKSLIKMGFIRTSDNGQSINSKYQLRKNEVLLLDLSEPADLTLLPEKLSLQIVFEDDHIIVINKQPGLVVHPGAGVSRGTLVNALLYHCNDIAHVGENDRPGIVHRLDKDTSGLLVVAKSDQAYFDLAKQFFKHSASRQYLAIVWGYPNPNYIEAKKKTFPTFEGGGIFKIEGKIGRHPVRRKKMTLRNDEKGKNAITRFKILESFYLRKKPVASLLRCWLETGRTHQIRVHMDAINHCIVGDQVYQGGKKSNLDLHEVLGEEYESFRRQALHAEKLSFQHPVSKKNLEFKASPPKDFQKLLKLLRKL